jgi:uncharacterized hydantoinase/oxoprolinase family protein
MKKTVSLLTSLLHVSLDNARHQVKALYTEELAGKFADSAKEIHDVSKEVTRVFEAEKKEFLDFQSFYEETLKNFSGFMQREIEKRFEEVEKKNEKPNLHIVKEEEAK